MTVERGEVRHDPTRHRYEYVVGGSVVAAADYRLEGDEVVMHHTYTEPAHRGQGIAARLVAGAFDDVRAEERRVVPACWFVAEFVAAHPEYGDLVVAP
jgi:predicted GNAT family acetyltransferase